MEDLLLKKVEMDGYTPFSANVYTYQERPLLPSGAYTIAQNVRDYRPGLKKRPGLEDIAPYNYLGPAVDLRPLYGEVSGDIYISAQSGYSGAKATQALARAGVTNNLTAGSEHSATLCAPGWKVSGGLYQCGRIGASFNLSRLFYVTTVTAASLFIYVNAAAAGPDSDVNASAIRLVIAGPSSWYQPGSSSEPTGDILSTVALTAYSDVFSFDPANYGADHIVEIPLNSTGIAAINAQLGSASSSIGLTLMEYDWDFLEDTGGTGADVDHYLKTRIDRYFPFLRLTFSDDVPALTSIYQYNQIRSGTRETLLYFENGDIMADNIAPPTTRGDVRPSVTGGDNGGYYPYSDGTPSDSYGLAASTTWAPSYDSKWGFFVFREGGLSESYDFNSYYTDTDDAGDIDDFKPSWGVLDDILIMANGVGYARFYGGQSGQPCKASCLVIDPAGDDTGTLRYNWDVDGITVDFTAAATSSSYVYLFSPVKSDKYIFDVSSANAAGTATWEYYTGSTWTAIGSSNIVDTTISGGVAFAQDGYVFSDKFNSGVPQRLNGLSGYWVRFKMSNSGADFTAKAKVFYNFTVMENVWDGVLIDFSEALFYDASGTSTPFYTYGNTTIDISEMQTGDFVYFSSLYIPEQIYVNVGNTPNTNSCTLTFEYWDGAGWVTWTVLSDGSAGFSQTGFVNMSRATGGSALINDEEGGSQKQAFNNSINALHWFRVSVSAAVSDNTRIGLTYQPILSMTDFGTNCNCACVWKERAVYSFDNYPSWIYITRNGTVNVLNGEDYAVLQAGDGRRHKVKCMRKFHNELIVWQEELGKEGGCTTIFEGYTPATFGKFLLSAKIGTLNADTAVVVDGALQASRSDYNQATLAYFLSTYGVFFTDGQTIAGIHDPIRDYFDPKSANCIRNGYNDRAWLTHDETHHVLRMGFVSGSSATEPNVFPVFDLLTKRWSFDAFATAHTPRCMEEISAESASSAVQVCVLAGSKDGDLFNATSSNLNDNGDTAIDMQVRIEFNASGHLLNMNEFSVRFKRQSAGNITFYVYENGVQNTDMNETIDMTQGETNEDAYAERILVGAYQDNNVSIFMQNNTINQDMYLFDYWIDADKLINR
jgi:hypothetical protein